MRKSPDRRRLRFESIDELLTEIDRIESADREGKLECLGNWSAGQVSGHVAAWIEYGFVGYPMKRPPWLIRMILRRRLKKYLRKGMPSGVRIPGVPEGTYGTEPMSTGEGAERLRRALARLQQGEPVHFESPAFGPMSYEDCIRLNLRHAELHLSFLRY